MQMATIVVKLLRHGPRNGTNTRVLQRQIKQTTARNKMIALGKNKIVKFSGSCITIQRLFKGRVTAQIQLSLEDCLKLQKFIKEKTGQ